MAFVCCSSGSSESKFKEAAWASCLTLTLSLSLLRVAASFVSLFSFASLEVWDSPMSSSPCFKSWASVRMLMKRVEIRLETGFPPDSPALSPFLFIRYSNHLLGSSDLVILASNICVWISIGCPSIPVAGALLYAI